MEPRINKARTYDFLCILKGTVTREANEGVLLSLRTIIEREGGELLRGRNALASGIVEASGGTANEEQSKQDAYIRTGTEDIGRGGADNQRESQVRMPLLQTRRLAYEIQNETNVFVATFDLHGLPDLPQRLKEALRHNSHILRYMLTQKIKHSKKHTKPKASSLRTLRDISLVSPEVSPLLTQATPAAGIAFGEARPEASPRRVAQTTDTQSPEVVREPIPQLTSEDIDKKIEEIIG